MRKVIKKDTLVLIEKFMGVLFCSILFSFLKLINMIYEEITDRRPEEYFEGIVD